MPLRTGGSLQAAGAGTCQAPRSSRPLPLHCARLHGAARPCPCSGGATGVTGQESIHELPVAQMLSRSRAREAGECAEGRLRAEGGRNRVHPRWGGDHCRRSGASAPSLGRRSPRPPEPGAVAHARPLLPPAGRCESASGNAVRGGGFGDSLPSE